MTLCTEFHYFLVVDGKYKAKVYKTLGRHYFLACIQIIIPYPCMHIIYGNSFLVNGDIFV